VISRRSTCAILPGWIETEMTANAFGNEKFAGNVMPRIPQRRWGTGATG
jgi:hypothetical protein